MAHKFPLNFFLYFFMFLPCNLELVIIKLYLRTFFLHFLHILHCEFEISLTWDCSRCNFCCDGQRSNQCFMVLHLSINILKAYQPYKLLCYYFRIYRKPFKYIEKESILSLHEDWQKMMYKNCNRIRWLPQNIPNKCLRHERWPVLGHVGVRAA